MSSPKYKLYYFDFTGRAEVIRLTLYAAGQSFEDVRFDREEWATKYKSQMPMNKVPVLKVNEEMLFETSAIIRYLGSKHGLCGNTEVDAARCDAVVVVVDEYLLKFSRAFHTSREERQKMMTEFLKDEVPTLTDSLRRLSGIYGKNGHIITDRLTYVDLYIYAFFQMIHTYSHQAVKDEFVDKNKEMVESLPILKEYFEKRIPLDELWKIMDNI
ncbi:hypothetical protein ACOME3_006753 [Neoechinorhynchus agilis]